mmetsp:Transcript_3948/g.6904  ORF Transcript_3948/g.6904 Transcript_3948/m.6904 type:complete len:115 (-) Transcript_3948:1056-1400(-)
MASAFGARFKAFMDHPAGPRTVFFWAPTMKWGLVIAGLADINRPVEKISVAQNLALATTGLIWTRWSFVITPKNYNLAFVNIFVGATGLYQISRVLKHKYGSSEPTSTPVTTTA